MTASLSASVVASLPAVSRERVEADAALLTRKDRKYLVSPAVLREVLDELDTGVAVLDTDGTRWFPYETTYFDTDELDSYHLAARRRPTRFKARTRTYVDVASTMVEVKTKDRRGRTVKHRRPHVPATGSATAALRDFAGDFASVAPHAAALEPTLTTSYRRATLFLPASRVRATVDAGFVATAVDGRTVGLPEELIVETKTDGAPSMLDRGLWRAGVRPVRISKYATGLAALCPELPSNRWHRIVPRLTLGPSLPA